MKPVEQTELMSNVKDLLNQALILMKDVPEAKLDYDYDYGNRMKVPRVTEENYAQYKGQKGADGYTVCEGDPIPGTEAGSELSAIKALLTELTSGNSGVHMFEQYYNSNC